MRDIQSEYDQAGQLIRLSDPDSTYTYTYDDKGWLKTVNSTGTPGVPGVLLTYEYDDNGNVLSVKTQELG